MASNDMEINESGEVVRNGNGEGTVIKVSENIPTFTPPTEEQIFPDEGQKMLGEKIKPTKDVVMGVTKGVRKSNIVNEALILRKITKENLAKDDPVNDGNTREDD